VRESADDPDGDPLTAIMQETKALINGMGSGLGGETNPASESDDAQSQGDRDAGGKACRSRRWLQEAQ